MNTRLLHGSGFIVTFAALISVAWVSGGSSERQANRPEAVSQASTSTVRLDLRSEYGGLYRETLAELGKRAWYAQIAGEAYNRQALILPEDRNPADVTLRRTEALLHDIQRLGPTRDLTQETQELSALHQQASSGAAQEDLYLRICQVRRRIAFANPLLNIDHLLFIKNRMDWPEHICDQFFGAHVGGSPTGGLFVLDHPFGPDPTVRDLLARTVVANGRLKGTHLQGGSFISPDVSFDGKSILFAYGECRTNGKDIVTLDSAQGIWNPQGAYHIFEVNADGSNLRQLTDGQWDDMHPCQLPDRHIAFISERRGGYGRCHGRPVPTYTLHSMNADGSGIVTMSFHETNEWLPSVNHEGNIIYTRWDYVDRGDCIAHHPWITTPDGRDPRALQGNYPTSRNARPDSETYIRAIPGSRKYVATASQHHGISYGSVIVIDPDVPDDGAMAPVKRVTPDCGFPETQGGDRIYGMPWPLSDTYFICMRRGALCLVDAFGNCDPIYRDPAINSLSPMPLQARPRPPIVPRATLARADAAETPAIVTVANIYDGTLPWPKGTRIRSLRVVELFPKATFNMDEPRTGYASESLCRGVLGTVPVEEDGSVCFKLPPGKPVYFQALNADGVAVQSMMSDTYVHPGERLTCVGCHERPTLTPPAAGRVLLALRRPPSTLTPDVDGAYPIAYPRLVQPVLDHKCVSCHEKEGRAPKLAGLADTGDGWTPSYRALQRYAFSLEGKPPDREPVRSTPGAIGAQASPLYKMLRAGHHGVQLTPEEFHRITVWLDCNSNFYGAYTHTDKQTRGEAVSPELQ